MKIDIYTDGNCFRNGKSDAIGAWGFIILKDNKLIYESSGVLTNTTNNKTELTSIIEALTICKHLKLNNITIFSDSKYCLDGITSWIKNWKKNNWLNSSKNQVKNKYYWLELDSLNQELRPKLVWIKGHNGNEWNEYVDNLCEKTLSKELSIEINDEILKK